MPRHDHQDAVRLIWHRQDLRLHDNELYSVNEDDVNTTSIISLFIFDDHYFRPQPSIVKGSDYDTIWHGPYYLLALVEAVKSLREHLNSIGGELIVRIGDPTIIIPEIVREIGVTEIYYNELGFTYEKKVAQEILMYYVFKNSGSNQQIKVVSKSGYTLYHPNDLPSDSITWDQLAHPKNKHKKKKKNTDMEAYECSHLSYPHDLVDVSINRFKGICKIMGDFRKAAKTAAKVRKPLPVPTELTQPSHMNNFDIGSIPTLEDLTAPLSEAKKPILGMDQSTIEYVIQSAIKKRNENKQSFGECAALTKIEAFLSQGHAATADRSKADVSENNSSRLSTYFALGTLSPRAVYWKAAEAGEGCRWLMSHLEMRDFFLFTAYANDSKLFSKEGIPIGKTKKDITWKNPGNDEHNWKSWATGKTGLPLVDAGMIELMSTGYCSNRVRQNVASVLTKDLEIDWRAGAEWFQLLLEDNCVGANFGNWLYFSGVGPDPKNRHFRTVSQALKYDADGEYVKKWLPMLADVNDPEAVFRPWSFGVDEYQTPIVDPSSQLIWNDLKRLEETNKLIVDDSQE